jgi:hypothetical protein
MRRRTNDALIVTMLVTALLIAIGWLGWQYQIVRHRQAMRSQIETTGGVVFVGGFDYRSSPRVKMIRPADYDYKIPTVRKWFGDEFVALILFPRQLTAADRQAIEALPESEVHAIP